MFNWRFKLQLWLSPKYFYKKSTKIIVFLLGIAGIFLPIGLLGGLFYAPPDYLQQDCFRIIYVHVPAAFLSLSIYAAVGVLAFSYMVWRIKLLDILASVSAPIGASFTILALVTGAIWGKPMWGAWWVWDARLTAELIMLFLYLGYIGLRNAIPDVQIAAKASAIVAIVGALDLPIIHYSVEWWHTLHQGATLSKFAKPAIASEMLYPLILAIIGFYALSVACVLLLARSQVLWRERRQPWVKRVLEEVCLG